MIYNVIKLTLFDCVNLCISKQCSIIILPVWIDVGAFDLRTYGCSPG